MRPLSLALLALLPLTPSALAGPEAAKPTAAQPAPAQPTAPADTAVVMNAKGLFAVSLSGAAPEALPAPKGPLGGCWTDPRANGVWVLETAPDTQPHTLHFVDLEAGITRPVVRGIPAEADEIVIDYGEAGRINGHDRVELRVGLAVRMGPKPAIEPAIGCEGDAAWYCYPEDQIGQPKPTLLPEYAARRDAIAKLEPIDGAWLATLAQRGAKRPLWRVEKPAGALPKVPVPAEACQAAPEDCGVARPVPGTPFWRVITANDRGDFYYQDEQLYDPRSKRFFTLDAPAKRSPTPLTGGQSIEGLSISPSGAAFAGAGRIARFDGAPVQSVPKARICGWTGPATRIEGPRG